MTWLLYLLGAYLACCYLWGMYLVVRLYTRKRLRVLLLGDRGEAKAIRAAARAASRRPRFEAVSADTAEHKAAA